jgi:hypothetical protein
VTVRPIASSDYAASRAPMRREAAADLRRPRVSQSHVSEPLSHTSLTWSVPILR